MTAPEETPAEFFARHTAMGPTHVIIVEIFDRCGNGDRQGVFSSFETATAWADRFCLSDGETQALFAPYIIDMPDFGNIPRKAMS